MNIRNVLMIILSIVILSACAVKPSQTPEVKDMPTETHQIPQVTPTAPTPEAENPSTGSDRSPLDPLPNEEKMVKGAAFVRTAELLTLESFPVQVNLKVSGSLPTPCHILRASVKEPDENRNIYVELYTLTDSKAVCIQVLKPFETSIPLGSFEGGKYKIYLNNKEVGEIDL